MQRTVDILTAELADYHKVRDVLEPTPYPDDWPRLKKTEVFKRQAQMMGLASNYYKVPQTTRFRSGINSCGVDMLPSTLAGQDVTGVNDSSKTTTLVTYLADAWNWGADMFCQCEVRHIEKVTGDGGGYIVYFAWHGHKRGKYKDRLYEDLLWVHAREAVFLGAGSIGTTEILLRSKTLGLAMSDCVGQGMSGNGDMLTFGYFLTSCSSLTRETPGKPWMIAHKASGTTLIATSTPLAGSARTRLTPLGRQSPPPLTCEQSRAICWTAS
jgi:hypothetical protein